tara:strand:- start:233 stop:751 length:519 start_codon:yes stop_codon:yes gene_type:complete
LIIFIQAVAKKGGVFLRALILSFLLPGISSSSSSGAGFDVGGLGNMMDFNGFIKNALGHRLILHYFANSVLFWVCGANNTTGKSGIQSGKPLEKPLFMNAAPDKGPSAAPGCRCAVRTGGCRSLSKGSFISIRYQGKEIPHLPECTFKYPPTRMNVVQLKTPVFPVLWAGFG